jgi:tetratricopeptide (TPR) repeat protein
VERQLARILAHPLFRSSQRLTAFLRFTVENTLAGRSHEVKESVIGADVFGLGETYNPQENPVVRIVAGRVRGKLAEYYLGQGLSDPVFIEIPKGGYIPRFLMRAQRTAAERSQMAPSQLRGATSVGRDRELGRLWAAFDQITGGGVMWSVSADAGMGKTTLGDDFLAGVQLQAPGTWIGRGACSERLAETDAYLPVIESLQTMVRGDTGERVLPILKDLAPTWYWHIMPLNTEAAAPGKERKATSRERMRREIRDLFEALSRIAPIILFLDDLHWADSSTCDLLAYLGAHLDRLRLFILMTCRPTAVQRRDNPFLRLKLDLDRRGICQEMPLPFLTVPDIEEYLARRFPQNRLRPEFAALVHERTEGNPLYMIDMLRFLRDRGVLENRDGAWQIEQPLREATAIVPTGISSLIQLKLHQLAEEDLQLLSCAAVQGVQFDSSVLAAVLSRPAAEVEERLQELETAHNLVHALEEQEFNHVLSIRYRFVHTYYQNVLYAALAPSRRMTYCLGVAEAMVALTGGTSQPVAADIAKLFEGGRDYAKAALFFTHAARNAARLFAYPESILLCEQGLRAAALTPESHERDTRELGLLLILNLALMVTQGYAAAEVERSHQRSLELCMKLKEVRRLPVVLWGLHTCLVNRGELVASMAVAQQIGEVAERTQDPGTKVQFLHARGTSLAFMGRLAEAHDLLAQIPMVQPATSGGSLYLLDPHVTSISMLARLLAYMGYADRAMARARESLDYAERLAHPQSIAYATFWIGWVHCALDSYEEGCRQLEAAMAMSQEYGLTLILEWGRIVRGAALVRMGRVEEGVAAIRESIEKQESMGSLLERSYCLTVLAEGMANQGAYSDAIARCDEALEIAVRTEGRSYEAETRRVRAELMMKLGADVSSVRCELEEALRVARETECRLQELRTAISYCRFDRDTRSAPTAASGLASLADWFGEANLPMLSQARGLLRVR